MRCLVLVLALFASATAWASEFLRFQPGNGEWQGELQTAINRYRHPSGVTVDLVAAVHVGDEAYYQELNEYFRSMDLVLYEMVTDATPKQVANASGRPGSPIGFFQTILADFLEVEFQLAGIDYGAANFQHADLTEAELREIMVQRNESFLTMFMTLATAQVAAEQQARSNTDYVEPASLLSIMQAINADDSRLALKSLIASELGRSGTLDLGAEAEQQITILGERNTVAIDRLEEALDQGNARSIALFYGAAHMPGLERSLLQDLVFEHVSRRWLTAWDVQ